MGSLVLAPRARVLATAWEDSGDESMSGDGATLSGVAQSNDVSSDLFLRPGRVKMRPSRQLQRGRKTAQGRDKRRRANSAAASVA